MTDMQAKRFILMLLFMLMGVTGAWAENEPCQHTFNAVNDVCDKCGHGFLFYEADGVVEPHYASSLKSYEEAELNILSNTCENGHGVIEFDRPLVIIGDWSFLDTELKGITIGNSVEIIGEDAFHNCNEMMGEITIGKSVTSIGRYAFEGTRFNKIVLPCSITSIDDRAFAIPDLREVDAMWHVPLAISLNVFSVY